MSSNKVFHLKSDRRYMLRAIPNKTTRVQILLYINKHKHTYIFVQHSYKFVRVDNVILTAYHMIANNNIKII